MERIEGNRIRVIGRKPNQDRDVRSNFQRQVDSVCEATRIKEFFREIKTSGNTADAPFVRDACYLGVVVSNVPKPRRNRLDANIDGPFGMRRRNTLNPVTTNLREDGETEPVIAFAFDGGKRVRALFYKRFNTLIFGSLPYNNYEIDYLRLVVNYLSENSHITVLPVVASPEAVAASYIHMVEIHKGEQRIVKLDVNRKLCTVGCDPEFEFLLRGQVVLPPLAFKGTSSTCEIGTDGAGSQIEIRPKAFEKPSDTISYMVGIMQRFPEGAGLSVSGENYPLGGHIHVGTGGHYSPNSDLSWLFDRFLGGPTLELSGGARGHYKRLGQFESKEWGFEYRTPPGAIFCSPEIARISMKICKTLTECYVNGQTMEINQPLQFEDYWNYAGLIPSEYEAWQEFLSRYNSSAHRVNNADVRAAWISEEAVKRYPSQIEAAKASPAAGAFIRRLREYPLGPQPRATLQRVRPSEEATADAIDRLRRAQERELARRVPVEPLLAHFNDEWASEVRGIFTAELTQHHVPPVVHFFGLANNRGNSVFGFDMPGYQRIEGEWAGYGIPYVIRMAYSEEDIARAREMAAHLATLLSPVAAITQVQQELPSVRTPDDGVATTSGTRGTEMRFVESNRIYNATPEEEFDAAFNIIAEPAPTPPVSGIGNIDENWNEGRQ